MSYRSKIIKEEQRKIIGIEPVVDMKSFVLLLLADLASKSRVVYFDGSNTMTACLRSNYKAIIESIMYQENGWGIKFAELIDIYSYYENQVEWEENLGKALNEVLTELNKSFVYDFSNDRILIDFTTGEIEAIKNSYDVETLEVMDHFSNLLSDSVFDRKWKLERVEMDRETSRRMNEHTSYMVKLLRKNGLDKV